MNYPKRKIPGCLLGIVLIFVVFIGYIFFQGLSISIFYFLLTWPIWLGKIFDVCLGFAQGSNLVKVIITIIFIIIGYLLYKLKKDTLIIFGVIELVGGVFIIWGTLASPSPDNLTNAIALGAALFLIVQGAENYEKGSAIEEEKT